MMHSAKKKVLLQKKLFLGIGLLCGLVTLGALGLQYFLSLPSCLLCELQRYPYILGFFLGVGGYFGARSYALARAALGLLTVAFLAGLGLSLYQVSVQAGWLDVPQFCQLPGGVLEGDVASLKTALLSTPGRASCDQVPFKIFGFSLAACNVVCSCFFLGLAWLLFRAGQGRAS